MSGELTVIKATWLSWPIVAEEWSRLSAVVGEEDLDRQEDRIAGRTTKGPREVGGCYFLSLLKILLR